MTISVQGEEIHLPDGRVTLADPERVCDSRYTNGDLAQARRHDPGGRGHMTDVVYSPGAQDRAETLV